MLRRVPFKNCKVVNVRGTQEKKNRKKKLVLVNVCVNVCMIVSAYIDDVRY